MVGVSENPVDFALYPLSPTVVSRLTAKLRTNARRPVLRRGVVVVPDEYSYRHCR